MNCNGEFSQRPKIDPLPSSEWRGLVGLWLGRTASDLQVFAPNGIHCGNVGSWISCNPKTIAPSQRTCKNSTSYNAWTDPLPFLFPKNMNNWTDPFLRLLAVVVSSSVMFSACARQQMNTIQFEPHYSEALAVKNLYGVGFDGYDNPSAPSNAMLPGWKKDAYARNGNWAKLVNIGSPRVEVITRAGERYEVPLKWVGEVPPEKFDGKVFIRIYNLEEGLIHWEKKSHGWDYNPDVTAED